MSLNPATLAVRTGIAEDQSYGAVVPPLYLSTNFSFAGFGDKRRYDYTRSGNPTRDQLAEALAGLEGGYGAVITSSGMSALTLLLHLVNSNARVVAPHDCYGGTFRLLKALAEQGRIRVSFVDQSQTEELDKILADGCELVLVETPSNPLLRVVDIERIAGLCAKHKVLLAADNTFLSPAVQTPIALGADLVVHSTTKYLNGHSDIVGGAIIARSKELHDKLTWWGNCLGLTGAPFDAFLTLRGLRTLHVRMRQHQENAQILADLLNSHPAVAKVYYPGLTQDKGHALAKKQQRGFGAMISFELKGKEAEVRAFLQDLRLFTLAESLGGVESLVAHPATMTHAAMTPEARLRAGISDGLIRLSVGIEDIEDLILDLKSGLERALRCSG